MKKEELEKLAHLARLELTEKEFQEFEKELAEILKFLEPLNTIDIQEERFQTNEKQENEFRKDCIHIHLNSKNIVKMFPEQKNSLAVVPKTFYKNSSWEQNSNSRRV
ncbi:MAG: Asp-tRNA(Asn)/Glu-tRNA(Gln) amidotransferase subunit GatC [Candidatus Diapherotrites archaeon]|nr:Asp-tRNA(Asn)/Glu-tRNA(Gln) amidotransferase subunit GatC [Candidatus Diapherotrites archaeon]